MAYSQFQENTTDGSTTATFQGVLFVVWLAVKLSNGDVAEIRSYLMTLCPVGQDAAVMYYSDGE